MSKITRSLSELVIESPDPSLRSPSSENKRKFVAESILTLVEATELLKVSDKTLVKMAKAGEIPAFKIAQQWRVRQAELDAGIEEQVRKQSENSGKE